MKKIAFIIVALLVSFQGFSQDQGLTEKQQRQIQKQLKKEREAEEAAEKAAVVSLMVEYHRFVLGADRLRDRRGNTVEVSSMINFIACDSLYGVIQIGSDRYVGLNGVGGITVEGPVRSYELDKNEKSGVYSVSYTIQSSTGSYDVRMNVFPSGRADANISSNWPGQINYVGNIVPLATSRVFKGTTSF